MPIPQVPSQLAQILLSGTYNAAWFSGSTNEQKIQNAINAAVTDGVPFVLVPVNMEGFNSALVVKSGIILVTETQLMTGAASLKIYNAAWFSGATTEAQITNAIAAAAVDGAFIVLVPLSMIPYDPNLVTFNTGVKMVREGGNFEHFDVVAYGGRQANGSVSVPLRKAVSAAVANGGGIIDLMTPFGTFVMLDSDLAADLTVYNKIPLTFMWGNYEVRVKETQRTRSHHHHEFYGTRFVMKDENGTRVTGKYLFLDNVFSPSAGLGGSGSGITTTGGSNVVVKSLPSAANWAKLEVGSPVLIFGFVPPLGTDDTLLNGAIGTGDTTITVDATTMFPSSGFVRIENEIIQYTGKTATTLTGCTRDAEGTTAATHADNTRVDRIVFQPFVVTTISGNNITVDGNMDINATELTIYIGSFDVSFDGIADFDGNQDPAVDDTANPQGINMIGAGTVYIGPGIVFRNWDHGGWALNACQDSVAISRGFSCTKPTLQLGSAFWVFGWSKRNTIDILEVVNAYEALAVDDRTTQAQLFDGPSEDSSFRVRVAKNIGNTAGSGGVGLLLDGCRRCSADIEHFHQHAGSTSARAVGFGGAGQWATETAVGRMCVGNVIEIGVVVSNGSAVHINVTGAGNDDNTIIIKSRAPVGLVQINNNLITVPCPQTLTYGASVATDAIRGEDHTLNVTTAAAFQIENPTNTTEGRRVTYWISNQSGGAIAVPTWGTNFRLAGAFVSPANNQYRMITFHTLPSGIIREISRTAADQAI